MATTPKRQRILEAFRDRLLTITSDDTFELRPTLFLGETPKLGADDPDTAILIVVQDTAPRFQGENVFENLPVEIQALAKADLDEPYVAVETILGRIIEAVELEDRTLGGLVPRMIEVGPTRTVPREEGSTTVGVAITYIAPYIRRWGAA